MLGMKIRLAVRNRFFVVSNEKPYVRPFAQKMKKDKNGNKRINTTD